MYQLSDQEMGELWILQRDATVLFSLSASCLSFAFGLWLEPDPGRTAETTAQFLREVAVPFFTLAAALLAALGSMALRRRNRRMDAFAERASSEEREVVRLEDTPSANIVSGAREPARTLLRW